MASTSGQGDVMQAVKRAWPLREKQITQLALFLQDGPCVPVFVHGAPSSGKTGVVRAVVQALGRPHAYVSCIEHTKPRSIVRAIFTQLKGKKRSRDDGFVGDARSDDPRDFVRQLQDLASKRASTPIIVIDNAERLADDPILSVLTRAGESLHGRLAVVLVSGVVWGSGIFVRDGMPLITPMPVAFPGYTQAQLQQVLLHKRPPCVDESRYAALLKVLLPVFWQRTRNVADLHALALALLPKYLQPLEKAGGRQLTDAELYMQFRGHLTAAAESYVPGLAPDVKSLDAVKRGTSAPVALDFDLPYLGKFLLMAGFLASHNRPALDKRLFSTGTGRRRGMHAHDKQTEEARAVARSGPAAFPRERLLAIFWALLQAEGDDEWAEAEEDAMRMASDVLMQISSLVSLRLFSQVGGDVLEGCSYRCNVSDGMARTLAANLGMSLDNYLMYV